MIRPSLSLILISLSFVAIALAQVPDYRTLHEGAIVIDTHNDVVQRILAGEDIGRRTEHGHSDLPRFKEGGVDVEMFSIWVPPEQTRRSYYSQANTQIDSIVALCRRNSSVIGLATTSSEVDNLLRQKKLVAMLGMEGGHPIGNDLKRLDYFYTRGVRYLTLTWNNSTDWATSAKDETDPKWKKRRKGLTNLGKQFVRRMNRLGMMVDISHVGERTFWDVLNTTKKPVIASHSSAWALCPHRRNLKDDQLKAIAKNGGVVFINFAPQFIDSHFVARESALKKRLAARIDSLEKSIKIYGHVKETLIAEALRDEYEPIRPSLATLVNHFDYIAKLIGVDHVGIGSDFDGISVTPKGMDDVTFLPNLTRELLKRGYSEADVKKILGGNFLRVLKANEAS